MTASLMWTNNSYKLTIFFKECTIFIINYAFSMRKKEKAYAEIAVGQ